MGKRGGGEGGIDRGEGDQGWVLIWRQNGEEWALMGRGGIGGMGADEEKGNGKAKGAFTKERNENRSGRKGKRESG